MIHQGPPPTVKMLHSINSASVLDSGEKNVLRAALAWWNPTTGTLRPSVRSLAAATGLTDRGVRKIMGRLHDKGVLVLKGERSKGGVDHRGIGRTSTWAIALPGAVNPELDSGLNPELDSGFMAIVTATNPERRSGLGVCEPGTRKQETLNREAGNPEPSSYKEVLKRDMKRGGGSPRAPVAQGECASATPPAPTMTSTWGRSQQALDEIRRAKRGQAVAIGGVA